MMSAAPGTNNADQIFCLSEVAPSNKHKSERTEIILISKKVPGNWGKYSWAETEGKWKEEDIFGWGDETFVWGNKDRSIS